MLAYVLNRKRVHSRGGKEAIHSNQALATIIVDAEDSDLLMTPYNWFPLWKEKPQPPSYFGQLHTLYNSKGEKAWFVTENSRIPVIKPIKGLPIYSLKRKPY